jgi:SAM-dependent methyltransferase
MLRGVYPSPGKSSLAALEHYRGELEQLGARADDEMDHEREVKGSRRTAVPYDPPMRQTSERNLPRGEGPEDAISRERHRFAYEVAAQRLGPSDDVLDVGCGEGYGAPILLAEAKSYAGIDLSEDVVGEARRNFGSERARFSAFDAARIPYDDSSFDAAVSFQVIEHVADVRSYLSEIRRVVKADGWAMFTTPNRLHRLAPNERPWNRFHLREYDPQGLLEALMEVFPSVQLRGVRASDSAEAIEIARVQRARRIARWDVLDLRSRLPGALNERARRIVGSIGRAGGPAVDPAFYSSDEADRGLDLLAVCSTSSS